MTRGFGPGREQTVSIVRFQAAARPLYGQPGTASRGPRPVAARGRRYGRRRGAFGPWLACPWAGKPLPGPGPSSGQGPGPGAATPCQPSSVAGKPRARRGRVRGPRAPFPGQTFRVWIGPPQPLAAHLRACCALSFSSLPPKVPAKKSPGPWDGSVGCLRSTCQEASIPWRAMNSKGIYQGPFWWPPSCHYAYMFQMH